MRPHCRCSLATGAAAEANSSNTTIAAIGTKVTVAATVAEKVAEKVAGGEAEEWTWEAAVVFQAETGVIYRRAAQERAAEAVAEV